MCSNIPFSSFYRRKIIESSIEIRELESKLKNAYLVKERKLQIDEKRTLELKEKVPYSGIGIDIELYYIQYTSNQLKLCIVQSYLLVKS